MMWVIWNLTSFHLEIVLMLVQDRCMVCARRTIGSTRSSFRPFGHGANRRKIAAWFASNVPLDLKSFWTHLMELLGDVGQVESHFILFRDSFSVGAR